MKYSKALNDIYYNLDRGFIYGTWQEDLRFPGYWKVLSKEINRKGKPIIYWNNYGSSAEDFTKKDLHWLITVLFKTTPEQFINQYECVSRYDYYHAIHNGVSYENVDNGYTGAFYNKGIIESQTI